MSNITSAIKAKKKGFHIGRRLILPFRAEVIKVILHGEIYTDFIQSTEVSVVQNQQNTSLFFHTVSSLRDFENSFEFVKLIVAEEDVDLSDINTHHKLLLDINMNHEVEIREAGENDLFVE